MNETLFDDTTQPTIDPALLVMHRNALEPLIAALRDLVQWCDEVHERDREFCAACAQEWPCAPERARRLLAALPPQTHRSETKTTKET